jgi:hypothetical protein
VRGRRSLAVSAVSSFVTVRIRTSNLVPDDQREARVPESQQMIKALCDSRAIQRRDPAFGTVTSRLDVEARDDRANGSAVLEELSSEFHVIPIDPSWDDNRGS